MQILCNNELRGWDQRHGYGAYLAEECHRPRGSEGTNEPKLAIMRDLGMSDVQAMRQHTHTNISMQTTTELLCKMIWYSEQQQKQKKLYSAV